MAERLRSLHDVKRKQRKREEAAQQRDMSEEKTILIRWTEMGYQEKNGVWKKRQKLEDKVQKRDWIDNCYKWKNMKEKHESVKKNHLLMGFESTREQRLPVVPARLFNMTILTCTNVEKLQELMYCRSLGHTCKWLYIGIHSPACFTCYFSWIPPSLGLAAHLQYFSHNCPYRSMLSAGGKMGKSVRGTQVTRTKIWNPPDEPAVQKKSKFICGHAVSDRPHQSLKQKWEFLLTVGNEEISFCGCPPGAYES